MIYEKFEKYWKIWLWIPIILLVLSIGIIANNILTTGSFMQRDIELTGGKSVTFEINSVDVEAIKSALPHATVHVTTGIVKNLIIEVSFDSCIHFAVYNRQNECVNQCNLGLVEKYVAYIRAYFLYGRIAVHRSKPFYSFHYFVRVAIERHFYYEVFYNSCCHVHCSVGQRGFYGLDVDRIYLECDRFPACKFYIALHERAGGQYIVSYYAYGQNQQNDRYPQPYFPVFFELFIYHF